MCADEADAGKETVEAGDGPRLDLRDGGFAHRKHATERCEEEHRGDDVNDRRPDREEESAERGAGHHPDLEGDRPPGHCVRQDLGRDERGREGPAGGVPDRRSNACKSGQGQELPELLRAGEGDEEQEHDDNEIEDDGDGDDTPARESVCELAGWKGEQEQRQKLGKPDQPEVER